MTLSRHGSNGHRSETTVVVQELASHGYVVVTADHPYDAFIGMMSADFPRVDGSSAADLWTHLRGWRRNLQIDHGTEISYSDAVWLLPQLARPTGMSYQELAGWIGTFSPSLAVRMQQTYPLAFFDLHLRHGRQPLLEGSSPPFPGVHFIP